MLPTQMLNLIFWKLTRRLRKMVEPRLFKYRVVVMERKVYYLFNELLVDTY